MLCYTMHSLSPALAGPSLPVHGSLKTNSPAVHFTSVQNSPPFHRESHVPHDDASTSDSIESDESTSPELSSSGELPATAADLPKQF